jgi:hypothetical protein
MRDQVLKGMAAGFAATLVISLLMIVKQVAGFQPVLNLVDLLSGMLHAPTSVGWLMHFVVGTLVWGSIFAVLAHKLPGATPMIRGVFFAVGAWLLMQLIILPLGGMGAFGIHYGFWAPVLTLALHVVYGVVLGGVYARLGGHWHDKKNPADEVHGALRYTHY